MAKVHPLHVINAEQQGAVAKLYTKPGSYRFYIRLLVGQFMHISYVTVTHSTKKVQCTNVCQQNVSRSAILFDATFWPDIIKVRRDLSFYGFIASICLIICTICAV